MRNEKELRLRPVVPPAWREPTINALSDMFKYRSLDEVAKDLGYGKDKIVRLRDHGGDGLDSFEIKCMSDYLKRRWMIVFYHLGMGGVHKRVNIPPVREALNRWTSDVKLASLKRASVGRLNPLDDAPPISNYGELHQNDLIWAAEAAQAEYKRYAIIRSE